VKVLLKMLCTSKREPQASKQARNCVEKHKLVLSFNEGPFVSSRFEENQFIQ